MITHNDGFCDCDSGGIHCRQAANAVNRNDEGVCKCGCTDECDVADELRRRIADLQSALKTRDKEDNDNRQGEIVAFRWVHADGDSGNWRDIDLFTAHYKAEMDVEGVAWEFATLTHRIHVA